MKAFSFYYKNYINADKFYSGYLDFSFFYNKWQLLRTQTPTNHELTNRSPADKSLEEHLH